MAYTDIFSTKTKEDREKLYKPTYQDRPLDQVLRRLLQTISRQNCFQIMIYLADNGGETARQISKGTGIQFHVVRPNLRHLEDVNVIYHEDRCPGQNEPWHYYLREPEILVALRMLQNIADLPRMDYLEQEKSIRQTQMANFEKWAKEEMGVKPEKPKSNVRRKRKRKKPKNYLNDNKIVEKKHLK